LSEPGKQKNAKSKDPMMQRPQERLLVLSFSHSTSLAKLFVEHAIVGSEATTKNAQLCSL
jgi:hypothetical protein